MSSKVGDYIEGFIFSIIGIIVLFLIVYFIGSENIELMEGADTVIGFASVIGILGVIFNGMQLLFECFNMLSKGLSYCYQKVNKILN